MSIKISDEKRLKFLLIGKWHTKSINYILELQDKINNLVDIIKDIDIDEYISVTYCNYTQTELKDIHCLTTLLLIKNTLLNTYNNLWEKLDCYHHTVNEFE